MPDVNQCYCGCRSYECLNMQLRSRFGEVRNHEPLLQSLAKRYTVANTTEFAAKVSPHALQFI